MKETWFILKPGTQNRLKIHARFPPDQGASRRPDRVHMWHAVIHVMFHQDIDFGQLVYN